VNTERGVENTEFSIWSLDFYLWCDRYPETQNPEWDEAFAERIKAFIERLSPPASQSE
jgi:hypothetical protein